MSRILALEAAMTRCSWVLLLTPAFACLAAARRDEEPPVDAPPFGTRLEVIHSGFDRKTCWVHARAGAIPGDPPAVVLTMQKLLLSGSDVFYGLNEMRTDDLSKTWSGPTPHPSLARRKDGDTPIAACDFTPKWHARSGKLLGTGQTVRYVRNRVMANRPRQIAYSVYDDAARSWAPWATVDLPDEPMFYSCGAGSTQRVDLPNGDILLPVYYKAKADKTYSTTVLRCRFDGRVLSYVEHGSELKLDVPRGFCEPSLARFAGRYFLTIRNDKAGYVARGDDGLHFPQPRLWRFDDGSLLGSYNTQQHWVVGPGGLFLVYTRKGANNDHVFRHRAPLFIAQVDPDRLCVLRATERVLVPERGARLGNFAVCEVSDAETWVTVTEWMQPVGCEKHGSDNSVYVARIVWRAASRP